MRVKLFSRGRRPRRSSRWRMTSTSSWKRSGRMSPMSASASSDVERVASVWYEEPHHRTVGTDDGGIGGTGGRAGRAEGNLGLTTRRPRLRPRRKQPTPRRGNSRWLAPRKSSAFKPLSMRRRSSPPALPAQHASRRTPQGHRRRRATRPLDWALPPGSPRQQASPGRSGASLKKCRVSLCRSRFWNDQNYTIRGFQSLAKRLVPVFAGLDPLVGPDLFPNACMRVVNRSANARSACEWEMKSFIAGFSGRVPSIQEYSDQPRQSRHNSWALA